MAECCLRLDGNSETDDEGGLMECNAVRDSGLRSVVVASNDHCSGRKSFVPASSASVANISRQSITVKEQAIVRSHFRIGWNR